MEHDVELNIQIWKQLKPHLMGGDVEEAAVDFVSTLMEHGITATDLAAYALDRELKEALREYADDDELMLDDDHDHDEWHDDWEELDGC